MSNLLFDTPYWILGALAIVGGALFVTGNSRTDSQMRNIGLGVFALGVVMFVVSWIVDTNEEKCLKRTKQLVEAVEKRDWDSLSKLMTPRCRLSILSAPGPSTYRSRDELIAGAKEGVERYDLKTATVFTNTIKSNPDFISVDVGVYSTQGAGIVQSLRTDWQLDWQETDAGWMCQEVIAKRVGGQGGEGLRRMFPPAGGQAERGPGFGGFNPFGPRDR